MQEEGYNSKKILKNALLIWALPPIPVVGTVASSMYLLYHGGKYIHKKNKRKREESRLIEKIKNTEDL